MNTIAVTKSPADRRKVCVDEGRRAGGSATAGGARGELAIWWAACLSSRGVARTRRARTRTHHRALPVRVAELVCDLGFDRVDDAHGVCLARRRCAPRGRRRARVGSPSSVGDRPPHRTVLDLFKRNRVDARSSRATRVRMPAKFVYDESVMPSDAGGPHMRQNWSPYVRPLARSRDPASSSSHPTSSSSLRRRADRTVADLARCASTPALTPSIHA